MNSSTGREQWKQQNHRWNSAKPYRFQMQWDRQRRYPNHPGWSKYEDAFIKIFEKALLGINPMEKNIVQRWEDKKFSLNTEKPAATINLHREDFPPSLERKKKRRRDLQETEWKRSLFHFTKVLLLIFGLLGRTQRIFVKPEHRS